MAAGHDTARAARLDPPRLEALAGDESRFAGVTTLGVDEHVWHHVSTKPVELAGRGPKEVTGMVDLTRDKHGKVRARLLDLVPGRTGAAYGDWLKARNAVFRDGIEVATLDPFHGYKNAIDEQLKDAVAVLDAFHVIKLGTDAVDECRRRVQQDIHGHRGRKGDPPCGIRMILRCGRERLTDKQKARLDKAIGADERHDEVHVAWQATQQLRSAYATTSLVEGRTIAEKVLASFPTCRSPRSPASVHAQAVEGGVPGVLRHRPREQRRHGGDQRPDRDTPAHRPRLPNRDNYRLRMLLIGGGLDRRTHPK